MNNRKYEIIKETDKVIFLRYGGGEFTYAKSCYKSVDDFLDKVDRDNEKWAEVKKGVDTEYAAMSAEERKARDEADRAVFERWQDEANTNAYFDDLDDEDADYNPFRR